MKKCMEKIEGMAKRCFEGEVTLPKTTLWLAGITCLLWGIVYGMKKAPWTHGVTIASNNGNTQNHYGEAEGEEKVEEDEGECRF